MSRLISLFGFVVLIVLAYLLSSDKKHINSRLLIWGIALQILFFVLIIGLPVLGIPGPLQFAFRGANDFVLAILNYTEDGTRSLFGHMANAKGAGGFIFAIHVLPTIIFMSSLMAVGYHLGFMQKIIHAFAWLMQINENQRSRVTSRCCKCVRWANGGSVIN